MVRASGCANTAEAFYLTAPPNRALLPGGWGAGGKEWSQGWGPRKVFAEQNPEGAKRVFGVPLTEGRRRYNVPLYGEASESSFSRVILRQAKWFRVSTGWLWFWRGAGLVPAGRVLRLAYHHRPRRVAGALVAPANRPSRYRFRILGGTRANVHG